MSVVRGGSKMVVIDTTYPFCISYERYFFRFIIYIDE